MGNEPQDLQAGQSPVDGAPAAPRSDPAISPESIATAAGAAPEAAAVSAQADQPGATSGGQGPRQFSPAAQSQSGSEEGKWDENLVRIYRCAKVVKGGRRFSFGALAVAGNRGGEVGFGYAKAREVPQAVDKASKTARRAAVRVGLAGHTIPHIVTGVFGASRVKLIPAAPGTGVIAGASVRAVLELAGVRDCLTKAYGSTNPKNLVKATMHALEQLRAPEQVARLRGVTLTSRRTEKKDQA